MPYQSKPDRIAVIALLALGACAQAPAAAPTRPPTTGNPCLTHNWTAFVGKSRTADLTERLLAATGRTRVRWVQPGTMVTMDYSEDRLTIYLDAFNRVERASCG
jgi:hypothetical protein